jgi:hypothetical protein
VNCNWTQPAVARLRRVACAPCDPAKSPISFASSTCAACGQSPAACVLPVRFPDESYVALARESLPLAQSVKIWTVGTSLELGELDVSLQAAMRFVYALLHLDEMLVALSRVPLLPAHGPPKDFRFPSLTLRSRSAATRLSFTDTVCLFKWPKSVGGTGERLGRVFGCLLRLRPTAILC